MNLFEQSPFKEEQETFLRLLDVANVNSLSEKAVSYTHLGTLVFSAAASLFLTSWNIYDCMAVGSGFAYYSLSSLLIVQLKEASAGIEIASQLGAIALLANIIREMLALFGAPLYALSLIHI